MRLLQFKSESDFSLTDDLINNIPPYAILSHTWGADTEEVTFRDLIDGAGKSKVGYKKIQFCGEQARRNNLQYFWIDTCCIDKSNYTELSEAINSMFRWYHNATKCYVYLTDVSTPVTKSVSTPALNAVDTFNKLPWELDFRKSRWFTRGWTLQELIAPTSVEFFSKEGEQIGNQRSLERCISEITGIPIKVLQGSSLSDFSITERMLWAERRQTTREEDMAYSLLGIFDINMPLIYGEGREKALKRLREEVDKASKGIQREEFSVAFSLSDVSGIDQLVGREEELAEIHRKLNSDGNRHTVILHGLGGIGKTQITVAYAKRHRDSYSAIFWLDIKDEDALKQSFVRVAKQILRDHPLALRSVDMKGDLHEVINAVKAWLSIPKNTRWLMIYDNYDNPKLAGNIDPTALDIRRFLPESYQGSILITTRSSEVKIGHLIQVRKLGSISDSLEIISNTSRRKGLMDDPDAIRLAKELDGFPLALATAGAYLDQVTMSLSDYLRLYKGSWAKLQKNSPELISYEDRTLYSTWQVSFDHIEQQNRLSAQILRFWAYFDNQDLWFELFQYSNADNPDWIQELSKDELSFHSAMRVLSNHGLVDKDRSSEERIESQGYSIHGCVHSWTIHILNQEWNYHLARVAISFVASHIPDSEEVRSWVIQRRLLQHAARCSHVLLNDLVVDSGMAWAYHNLGFLYMYQVKLAEAEQMYQRALQGHKKALGVEHTSTLTTVNNLGLLYADQGKLAEAEQMYQWALQGREKALSAEHTSTLNTVNNLGNLYADQGKLAKAEQMYQRALQGYEKALGMEHTSTLNTVNNLGSLYQDQGKLAEAEQMYDRALQGREKALGAEHTSTLNTVNNLGSLYTNQGKLAKAEQMYDRALQGREKALGADHTLTLNTVNNLGNLYKNQGKLAEAEQMHDRALQGYEKALGKDNISTYIPALNTIWCFGSLFEYQGDLVKARIMYSKAFEGYEKVGLDHFRTWKLRDILHALDIVIENKALKDGDNSVNNSQDDASGLTSRRAQSEPRRSKRRKKLHLR